MSFHDYYGMERALRLKNIITALRFAKDKLPSAVREETGEAVDEILSGILPAILMALVIVAGSTLVGLVVGALIGAFAAGVGAAPGAAAGGTVGLSAGMGILEWLGLAFLAVHVGQHMAQVTSLVRQGFEQAWGWGARDSSIFSALDRTSCHQDEIPGYFEVVAASEKFARAVAVLIRLVLEGVVLYLTTKGIAKLPELVAQLKNSRLGEGFAVWVEKNYQGLLRNPKLTQKIDKKIDTAPLKPAAKTPDHPNKQEPSAQEKSIAAAPSEGGKLRAGSPEHKADRWEKYQKKGGTWDHTRWSKQYDTNMQNSSYGLAREKEYRDEMGGTSKTLKTPYTNRQIDIFKSDEGYAGQLKTGKVTLNKENIDAIQKDKWLAKEGYNVEHILEKGASQSYLDALDEAGITYKIGPQIPEPSLKSESEYTIPERN